MSDRKRNILDAAVKIDFFGEANPQLASEVPYTVALFLANKNNILRLNAAGITSASALGAGMSGTRSKVARIEEIEADIRLVAQTARLIDIRFPDFQNTFILPRGSLTYDQIIQFAESFVADVPPDKDKFAEYALFDAFFTALTAKVVGYRLASQEQADGKREGVGATAEAEDALRATLATRKELDRVIKNHYRNNPQKLAEWLTASHIRRKQETDEPENPPTP
jgi:hypothetical protein